MKSEQRKKGHLPITEAWQQQATVKVKQKKPFLRPGPKLLAGLFREKLFALLEPNSVRPSQLLAKENAR